MISATFKFWSYLIFLIPSILCSVFALYYLLSVRSMRHALYNHNIIILLILGLVFQVICYPWLLHYYRVQAVWERSFTFCQIWTFIDWGEYIAQAILFAWATIERHILVFHDQWVATKMKRFFVHYLPPIVLLLYCSIFYSVAFFFPPCKDQLDYFYITCVTSCIFDENPVLAFFDGIINQIIPFILIILSSLALLVRATWQKYRMQQAIHWRKQRKMTIQLLSISMVYLMFAVPFTIVDLMIICGFPREKTAVVRDYLLYFQFFICLLTPFVCILSLPELRERFIRLLHVRQQPRRVTIGTLVLRNSIHNRVHIQ